MKFVRWSLAGVVFGLALVGSAATAHAGLDAGSTCSASAHWDSGLSIDAATSKGVVTVPRKATVDWTGSVTGPPGAYHGSLTLQLPPPFGSVAFKDWKGNSTSTSNAGTDKYDLPSFIPGGMTFVLKGMHVDSNGTCSGSVELALAGSATSSPLAWVSLGGTVLTGGTAAWALRALFRRVV